MKRIKPVFSKNFICTRPHQEKNYFSKPKLHKFLAKRKRNITGLSDKIDDLRKILENRDEEIDDLNEIIYV